MAFDTEIIILWIECLGSYYNAREMLYSSQKRTREALLFIVGALIFITRFGWATTENTAVNTGQLLSNLYIK